MSRPCSYYNAYIFLQQGCYAYFLKISNNFTSISDLSFVFVLGRRFVTVNSILSKDIVSVLLTIITSLVFGSIFYVIRQVRYYSAVFHHRFISKSFIKLPIANQYHRSFTSAASAPAAQFCDKFKAGVSLYFPFTICLLPNHVAVLHNRVVIGCSVVHNRYGRRPRIIVL